MSLTAFAAVTWEASVYLQLPFAVTLSSMLFGHKWGVSVKNYGVSQERCIFGDLIYVSPEVAVKF